MRSTHMTRYLWIPKKMPYEQSLRDLLPKEIPAEHARSANEARVWAMVNYGLGNLAHVIPEEGSVYPIPSVDTYEILAGSTPPARRAEPHTIEGHDVSRPGREGLGDGNHDPTGGVVFA